MPVYDLASPQVRESHLAERESKGKSCFAMQHQVKTQEKAFVTSLDHHRKCSTKTFAHNWHDPYISGGCTPYPAHLKKNSHRTDDEKSECDGLLLGT